MRVQLDAIPWPVWLGLAAAAGLVLYRAAGGTASGAGQAVGRAAVDAAGGAVSGVALGVGDAIGLPRTDVDECEAAIRAGDRWGASFKCPAGRFIRATWSNEFEGAGIVD